MVMTSTENGYPSRSAIVVYGTETGNAQDLAEEVGQILQRQYFVVDIEELDHVAPLSLAKYALTIFCLSTTGQGDFPSNARKFWSSLLRKKLPSDFLGNTTYALVGLCDSSYPKFNFAGRKLHKRLQQLGAIPLLQPCEADEQGEDGTEGAFLSWARLFKTALSECYPLRPGQEAIADGVRLPSRVMLVEKADSSLETAQDKGNGTSSIKQSSHSSEASFSVELVQNERITPQSHWQDVRWMKLHTDTPVTYMPGDAIGIHPENSAEDVRSLLELQDWTSVADKPLCLEHNQMVYGVKDAPNSTTQTQGEMTLRGLLTNRLDINSIPRRSFFAHIAHFTDDEMQKERAQEFTDPQYLDEYFDYATRPRRSILEVLQEFHTVKIPWQEVLSVFPTMRPRQFSIASGGDLKDGGSSFELLVAIVRYKTVIRRIREGVCTKYLAKLPLGTKLNVSIHTEGRFHAQKSKMPLNHLLIGGGTGIAPLRALIHEKLAMGFDGQVTLIFGCRNIHSDYFFSHEWQLLSKSRDQSFRIITAFSRDQQQKVYVQDRIRENATSISRMLLSEDATVVVCGSSGAMPKAVREALKDVLAQSADFAGDDQAEQFLARLEKDGRYKQETW